MRSIVLFCVFEKFSIGNLQRERETKATKRGDEPGLTKLQDRSEVRPVSPVSSDRQDGGYVPTVGRWGSEWPS
ncbi:hypothetical protein DMENIID0001_143320 [Sergentomyia squamirostris]